MNPILYELLDKNPILFVPLILLLTFLFYHLLFPVYTTKVYRRGDNETKPRWNQIVDGESTHQKAEGIY